MSCSSAVPSNWKYFHTGKGVRVFGQHHWIAIQTDLTETWPKVVIVAGLAESVYGDISDVVVLKMRREVNKCTEIMK